MTKVEQTQVLIAGGGPVGLIAALCAARRGLDVIVLERSFRGTPRGHTTLIHPSSIRLLAELGLAPLLLRAGQLLDQVELRVDSDFYHLRLPFPALSITQAVLEETLLQVLRKEEVDLRATCEVAAVLQTEHDVEVKAVRREQLKAASSRDECWELTDSSAIRAKFVIGADGRASHVRHSLGIRMFAGPTERYAMFEFPSAPPPQPMLAIMGKLSQLITPLVDRRARCSFQLAPEAQPTADLALLATLLRERAPQQATPRELYWSGILDFEPAIAEVFGRGRVWLAGDAAHTASPLGVQSMNRGLSEVYRLVEAIAAVDAGKSALTALEQEGSAQRESWRQTLAGDACFQLLPHAPSWLSGNVQQIVSALPASGPDLADLLGQVGIARRANM